MSRTSSLLVQKVLLSDYDGSSDLSGFMDAAAVLVDRVATCATARGTPLSATELEMLERYLTAHFYAVTDRVYTSKRTADSGASYAGQMSTGLLATPYGQAAVSLDWSGCLAAIATSDRKTAGGFWLGKPPTGQIEYEDRR